MQIKLEKLKQVFFNKGHNIVLIVAASGWLSRILSASCQLVQIRILSKFLGIETFAAYAVMTGLAGWYLLADFGFGKPLQNRISWCRINKVDASPIIFSTILLVTVFSVVLVLITFLLSFFLGPFLLGKIHSVNAAESSQAFAVYSALSIVMATSSIMYRIMFAEHKGYIVYAITGAGAVTGLLLVYLLSCAEFQNPLTPAIIASTTPTAILPFYYMGSRFFQILSGVKFKKEEIKKLIVIPEVVGLSKVAKHFLWISFASACVNNVDYIISSQYLHVKDIAMYAVSAKLFGFIYMVESNFLLAAAPVFTEYLIQKNYVSLKRLLVMCLGIGTVCIVASAIVFFVFQRTIFNIIIPNQDLSLSLAVVMTFCWYWIVRVWCDTFATIIHSSNKMIFISIATPVQAVFNAVFMIYGTTHYGLMGLVLGSSLSFILTAAWILPLQTFYLIRR